MINLTNKKDQKILYHENLDNFIDIRQLRKITILNYLVFVLMIVLLRDKDIKYEILTLLLQNLIQ